MKLNEVKKLNEKDEGGGYSPAMGKRLADQQMEMAHKAIVKKELDKAEIKDLAKQFEESEAFGRTAGSSEFLLSRMHILIHGLAPHGETESRAETMFNIPKTMVEFANKKGIDTFENIEKAKVDLKGRPRKVKLEAAKKMMADFYKANKDKLSKNITKYREDIIKDIMAGGEPAKVFATYSK